MKDAKNKTVIIILGPTGVGKTALSIQLAKLLNTEIISADSMLVYRHMDIGTAKPSIEELEAVPHHLINILSPSELFSAGMFKEKSVEIIDRLQMQGRVPLIVGGTGFYISSLTRGLFEGPGADEELRQRLMEEEIEHGRGHLYNRLVSLDPEAAEKIEPNDLRRVIRLLEIRLKGGKGISEIHKQSTVPSDYDFIKIGLSRERKELYPLIEDRVDSMMKDGLLEETQRLLEMKPERTALQALGYKEMRLYLEGEVELDEAVRLTKKRTKMYAKRQFTWFRKEPDINWVDITGAMDSESIFKKVMNKVDILGQIIYS